MKLTPDGRRVIFFAQNRLHGPAGVRYRLGWESCTDWTNERPEISIEERLCPVRELSRWGSVSRTPALVLAPELALSLLPSRGLSSAPVARSVSLIRVSRNDGRKKRISFRSAFRHGDYRYRKQADSIAIQRLRNRYWELGCKTPAIW